VLTNSLPMKDAGELFTEISLFVGASKTLTSASVCQSLAALTAAVAQITTRDVMTFWSVAHFSGDLVARLGIFVWVEFMATIGDVRRGSLSDNARLSRA
jgi:hypothetical protein